MTELPESPIASARLLARWGEARGWRGSDPYDGLNAARLPDSAVRRPLARRALIQAVKRSPADLRPLLGIPPGRNAAALADVVSAYALAGDGLGDESGRRLRGALDALLELRAPGFDEPCWGYHFDVQTRVFFYPSRSPNTIATSFAGSALLDAFERTRDERLLATAAGVGEFFSRRVPLTRAVPGAYFGYLPGDRTPIHNANLLVAAVLARLWAHTGRADWADAARSAVEYTVRRQRTDGSWSYGEQPSLQWIDNFHTGYVLESLMSCDDAGLTVPKPVLERGLEFFRSAMFLRDGTPKYYPHEVHPVDAQCVAQAIKTFAIAARRWPTYGEDSHRVWGFAKRRMRRSDGLFVFQLGRWTVNRTPHMRWVQTPMLRALVELALLQRDVPEAVA